MIKYFSNYNLIDCSFAKLNAVVKYYIETDEYRVVQSLIKHKYNPYFLGNCSKLIFCFDFKNALFIKYLAKNIKLKGSLLQVDSGVNLKELGNFTISKGIKGFEKIATIPGLVGGSLVNNASYLDQCISTYLYQVIAINGNGNIVVLFKKDIIFKYRYSSLREFFVLKAIFKIEFEDTNKLLYSFYNSQNYRLVNQPKMCCLGSTFKNYGPIKAYKLISLIYYDLGNEMHYLNDKHLNFINLNLFSHYLSIVKLIERIEEMIYNKKQILLKREIQFIY